eukprot:359972-Chlamydomonas_euryale.AAC.1
MLPRRYFPPNVPIKIPTHPSVSTATESESEFQGADSIGATRKQHRHQGQDYFPTLQRDLQLRLCLLAARVPFRRKLSTTRRTTRSAAAAVAVAAGAAAGAGVVGEVAAAGGGAGAGGRVAWQTLQPAL